MKCYICITATIRVEYSYRGGEVSTIFIGESTLFGIINTTSHIIWRQKRKTPFVVYQVRLGCKNKLFKSSFLPSKVGLQTLVEKRNFSLQISNPIRAQLECLYLAPKKQGLVVCYEIMEGLNNVRPKQVQDLLEKCSSIKVKRLFLYMAEKSKHAWFKYIVAEKIDTGKGKRSLVKDGVNIAKYRITIPKALAEYE